MDRDVLGMLTTGHLTILLQQDCTPVILVQDIINHDIPLCFQKVTRPDDQRHQVVDPYQFTLSQTASVEFLLPR